MTDKTQPEALRLADELEFVSGGWGVADQCCAELRRQHTRIAELEAELEAVGAGGVQALSAAPVADIATAGEMQAFEAWYKQDCVIEGAAAKMAAKAAWKARAMLAASPTPPAEQQAAPKAAPAWEHHARKLTQWLHCMSHNDSYFGEPAGLVKQVTGELNRLIGAAPQQEAQEPVALLVRKNSWRAGQWEAAPPDSPHYGLTWANQRKYVYEAPQPAPAPLSDDVVKDAARYQWLRENWFTMTSNYQRCITFKVGEPRWSDITEEELDAAIDAARKQGANHD